MSEPIIRTYRASFQNRELEVEEFTPASEAGAQYRWRVANSGADENLAQGESGTLEDAMISAAGAAGADWGRARWRRVGDDDQGNEDQGDDDQGNEDQGNEESC